jgi:rfaE bifunctional protein nucleotidyltransferase chain/domain
MDDIKNHFHLKIQPLSQAKAFLNELKTRGPLVFTNGVFDVLHRGHVTYLEQARALGASLVVALNTDLSAKRLGKGPERPLNNEVDRAWVIAALESVSLVTWFDEDTPLKAVQFIEPDFLVKGGDYDMDLLEEARWVRAQGGQALAIPFVSGYSTTQLVQKIKRPSSNSSPQ